MGHGIVGDGALREVALVEEPVVDADAVGLALRERLARQRDHPLHQVVDAGAVPLLVGLGREHDDVAPVQVVQVVAQLVDEDAVADLERRHHRLRRDVERLEQERLDDDRDDDRHDDQDPPLERTARLVLRLPLAAAGRRPRPSWSGAVVAARPPDRCPTGARRSDGGSTTVGVSTSSVTAAAPRRPSSQIRARRTGRGVPAHRLSVTSVAGAEARARRSRRGRRGRVAPPRWRRVRG